MLKRILRLAKISYYWNIDDKGYSHFKHPIETFTKKVLIYLVIIVN